jgi:hypothetical protein
MPRTGRFNDKDLSHADALKLVASWLSAQKVPPAGKEEEKPASDYGSWFAGLICSQSLGRLPQSSPRATVKRKRRGQRSQPSAPLELAQAHLRRHGVEHRQCKLCGAAWAIVHCDAALKEETGHRLLEAVSASRKALEGPYSSLYEAATRYVESRLGGRSRPPGVAPAPREIPKKHMHLLFNEVQVVLHGMLGLASFMADAESNLAGRFVAPPLSENPGRRPRDYLRTAIDCYLFRHGWTVPEIFALYHPDSVATPQSYGSIYDAVERARTSVRPPLIGGWPESGKRAHRIARGKKTRRASA